MMDFSESGVYAYDGSLEGLLCAYAHAVDRAARGIVFQSEAGDHQAGLFPPARVESSPEKARAFWEKIKRAGTGESSRHVLQVFLSEIPGFESVLYDFVRLTIEQDRCLVGWHSHACVNQVLKWSRKVGFEAHRFTGLLRFEELRDGSLYAPYEPDHNITLLLSRHFRQRLRGERWVIHDRRRNIGLAWDGSEIHEVIDFPEDITALHADHEAFYQNLWRQFTSNIAIGSRRNPHLQRQFMPRRYWKYLTEKTPRKKKRNPSI